MVERIEEIEAREKAAWPLTEFEVEQWRGLLATLMHDASLGTTIRWKQELRALATIDGLLAQLREARGKLEAVGTHLMAQSGAQFRDARASYEVIYRILHPQEAE